MRRLLRTSMSCVLMLMLTLAGCGGSSSQSHSSSATASASQTTSSAAAQTSGATSSDAQASKTAQTSKTPHTPRIAFPVSSPVFSAGNKIPTRYTCYGAGTSPPLRWGAIPHGAVELVLFILGNDSAGRQPVYWAVAGLHPTLTGISAGRLPPGAIVGRNTLGQSRYTICPVRSEGLRHYAVALLALPRSVAVRPGFNANAFYKAVLRTAEYAGLTTFTYQRR